MRKAFVTKTVLQLPEAWKLFCDNFPTAVVTEDVSNKEVLIVYTDGEQDA
jgi:hypothetical protein